MKHSKIVLLVFSSFICLILAECAIRFTGEYDRDGNFYFRNRRIRPYRLPLKRARAILDRYPDSKSYIVYSPTMGWTISPGGRSRDQMYTYSAGGIRCISGDELIAREPRDGSLRIAILGDSYTHGDDVPFVNTWGFYLEEMLRENGIDAEVLNFGVPAYGMDQAFLRWQYSGRHHNPDIVLFGLALMDMRRNVNLIRPLYDFKTGLICSKPRFLLQGSELELINSPPPRPEEIPAIMDNMESWDLCEYEHWYDRADYTRKLWHKSRLASLLLDSIRRKHGESAHGENHRKEILDLSLGIVSAFREDVEETGAEFYIVSLPSADELRRFAKHGKADRELSEFENVASMIHTEAEMAEELKRTPFNEMFIPHYSATGNRVVARNVSEFILKQQGSSLPPSN